MTFDPIADRAEWLPVHPDRLRAARVPESRRVATVNDPLLFAYIYLRHHLASDETGGLVTFSHVHDEWAEHARRWAGPLPGPQEQRDAFVAPRSMGKSTWWFLVLPMWAAAHGHSHFTAAFADSSTQAETHLATFKHELDTNELLRTDYPDLCRPAKRPRGATIADTKAMLFAASGYVFAARGVDSAVLGLKVGSRRPDLMIVDDIEPEEARYSADQAKKRLGTLRDGIFPLNVNARVVIVGTVTMPGSIIHQLVKSVRGGEVEDWITEENVRAHYYAPIVTADDGTESSVWPGRWSMDFLSSIRHTRTFLKNYANDPRGYEGGYWRDEDFTYGTLPGITRRLLSVDPAVTTKKSSDPTGVAVVGMVPEQHDRRTRKVTTPRKAVVEHAEEVRLTGSELRAHCLRIVERWEEAGTPIQILWIETNQGGDVWLEVFHDFPIPVRTLHQTEKKEVRAASALAYYQRGHVRHAKRLSAAEDQMVTFPVAPHDDMVDAIGSGVLRFLDPPKKARASGTSVNVA